MPPVVVQNVLKWLQIIVSDNDKCYPENLGEKHEYRAQLTMTSVTDSLQDNTTL